MLTTGTILNKERIRRELSIEDVEKKTRIRKKYLSAIENDDWSIFPSKTYILGILKSYGKFLDLDGDKLTAFFRREYEKKEEIRFKRKVPKTYLTPNTKRALSTLMFIFILCFIAYFGFQLKLLFSTPNVEILSPTKNLFIKEEFVELVGKTDKETIIIVNGEKIIPDKNSIFRTKIPLAAEVNKVVIEVTGANGRKTILTRYFERKK
ncbi:hypothetical protein A3C23_03025 [Candidatus Roizmanbacteria bacterium RIFCSPHIGHO2_02_FULL_37_13b]|uniref:HTH cro/C1-type domain-containing protein n=1 Tax=Candidatus Roizmanbacteria bacterium RIFCSPLOWO2_02_FULL_36_11 TaxID=1802071 RepID=A0A1F7JI85_9BACT|nr:MAG: hypothetical protein A3C23_03025 [Candidatus Roizmanbacteria bacterium RIFCSPHIGHO2_02_FULL_37_13b]OGK55323.1 MAG: hypothetical protein A3H78_04455 [Candidatus Roizmanbacteria bacterium RIFCSPLOWO2_02_FULL_36_11]